MSYIKSINNYGRYINVSISGGGGVYNNYSSAQGVGNMRFNTSTQNIEVWDGSNWMMLGASHADINLSIEAQELLDWAKQKKQEESELEELCNTHPGVQEAYERLQILKTLTKSAENKSNSNP